MNSSVLDQSVEESLKTLQERITELEQRNKDLEVFAWNTAQWCVALADRNRWLTGVDFQRLKDEGKLPDDLDTVVTNWTAWVHFTRNGQGTAFNNEFHKPDGLRDMDKLIKQFRSFLQTQTA